MTTSFQKHLDVIALSYHISRKHMCAAPCHSKHYGKVSSPNKLQADLLYTVYRIVCAEYNHPCAGHNRFMAACSPRLPFCLMCCCRTAVSSRRCSCLYFTRRKPGFVCLCCSLFLGQTLPLKAGACSSQQCQSLHQISGFW